MSATVIVTGASSGIGAEIAREFSKHGYFVVLLGRSLEKLLAVQKTLSGKSSFLAFDLKDLNDHADKLLKTFENIPPVEILINNAGVYSQSSFSKTTPETWIEQFTINLLGPVQLTQLLWPIFTKNKKGSILNISSSLGIKPAPNTSAYSAIKAAMNNWTITLAQEGAAYNIRANVICPGIVDTPIHGFHAMDTAEKTKVTTQLAKLQMLNFIGEPSDIAKASYFLASDESKWTTASVLSVDGGIGLK